MFNTQSPLSTSSSASTTARSSWVGYAVSICSVAAALAISFALGRDVIGATPFLLFFPAIMLSGWFGGLGAGLLATLLSLLLSWYFFIPGYDSFRLTRAADALRLILFAVEGAFISMLNEAFHRSRRRATDALGTQSIAEGQTRDAEQRYRAFLENSNEAIWRFECEEPIPTHLPEDEQIDRVYRVAYLAECNEVMARMYGYVGPRELIGARVGDLMPRDVPANVEYLRNFIRSGYRLADAESEERDKLGNVLYFMNNLVGVIENGAVVRAWGTQRDVTALHRATAALAESEARFRTMADTAPVLMWVSDADGRRTYFNRAWLEFSGRTAEQEAGLGWADNVHPDDIQRCMAAYTAAHAQRKPFTLDYRRRRSDGQYRWMIGNAAPRLGPDGEFVGFIGASVDVTDRREAERRARERDEQLRLVTDSIPALVSFIDRDHRYRFTNRAYETWFGVRREEVNGKHMRDVLGEAAYERVRPHLEQAFGGQRAEYEAHVAYRGGPRHIHATYVPHAAPDGTVDGVVALVNDITARKEHEASERFIADAAALLGSSLDYNHTLQQLTRLAVPTLADGCLIDMVESDGTVRRLAATHVDPAKEQLAVEIRNRYPARAGDPGVMTVVRTGRPELYSDIPEHVLTAIARDGEHLRMIRELAVRSAMVVPLVARGRTLGAITFSTSESGRRYEPDDLALAEDLAARAALAVDNARLFHEAQRANRMKDEFLATVSHELRTPLNAILGWSQLLRAARGDAHELQHGLATIERNAKAQAQLIEDLLDISRIITGKLRLDVRPVDLAHVIDAAIQSIRPAADAKEIRVTSVLDPRAGPVFGDAGRLQQVVWNLLSNAVKFTPRGGRVGVRLARVNSHVEVVVSDSGQGIGADFLPQVFDRFRQADATTTRKHQGLGIGLSIVRHLVELHGGTVQAESPGDNQGSVFTVRFPLTVLRNDDGDGSPHAPPPLSSTTPVQEPPRLDGVRVLVVDDEPDARDLLARVLRDCSAEVTTVASAADAIAAIRADRPDVLLSDIGMPDEDGYALIQQVRAMEEEAGTVKLPAAALTAFARAEDRRRALLAGFQMHVPKPVEPAELATVVANLAGRT